MARTAGCAWSKASPAAVYLLENRSRLSTFVAIEIDQNTKVQVITSTIGQFITKLFKLVVMNYLYACTLPICYYIAITGKQSSFC